MNRMPMTYIMRVWGLNHSCSRVDKAFNKALWSDGRQTRNKIVGNGIIV